MTNLNFYKPRASNIKKFIASFYIGSFIASMVLQPLVFFNASANVGSPDNECQNADFDFGIVKYSAGSTIPENGSVAGDYTITVTWSGTNSVSWTSNPVVAGVVSKEGNSSYVNNGGTSGTIVKHGQNGFSHITFCGNDPVSTPTLSPSPTVSGSPAPSPSTTPTPSPSAIPALKCILEITKEVDTTSALSGEIINYEINFKNIGNIDCTGGGVKVADVVNTNLVFISAEQSSNVTPGYSETLYNSTSRLLAWNANVLNPGESGWVKWEAKVKLPANTCNPINIPNIAKISANELNWQWVLSNEVVISASSICATPTPSSTPSPSSTPTPTPSPTVSGSPAPSPSTTPTPSPSATPTPTPTPTPEPEPECTECETQSTPTPTSGPTPTPCTNCGGGGGGGGGGGVGYVLNPSPSPSSGPTASATPIPVVLGASDVQTEILGGILPATGFSLSDNAVTSIFNALALSGIMVMLIGFGLVPKDLMGVIQD